MLRTPEAEALAELQRSLQPALVVDAHEPIAPGRYMPKFGGIKGHDLLIQDATTPELPPALSQAAERLLTMGGIQPDLARNTGGRGER